MMPLLTYIILHGLLFAGIITFYLLTMMKLLSPRVWAMGDYPKSITEKVSPQTKEEKKKGAIVYIPFLIIGFGIPIISTLMLKVEMGGQIDIISAFLNLFGIFMLANIADLIILDILIVGTITPKWVVIPGTEDLVDTEYKTFRKYHAKAHVKGSLIMAGICFLIAILISIL